jgi:glucose repression regulatory protein TUP1
MFDEHQDMVTSLAFSLDGRLLVSGSDDKTVRVWDVGSALGNLSSSSMTTGGGNGIGSDDGAEVANGVAKPIVLTVIDNAQEEMGDIDVDGDVMYISNDSDRQVVDESGDSIRIDHNRPNNATVTGGGAIVSIAVSTDGRYVAAGSQDSLIRLWDLRRPSWSTGEKQPPVLIERLKGHKNGVYGVSFTKNGRFLVSASLDRDVRVWDVGHLGIVAAPGSWSLSSPSPRGAENRNPDKRNDGAGGKWGQKSHCSMRLVGHCDYVVSVAASLDSRWVVSGGKDRGAMWWDLGLSLAEDSSTSHGECSTMSPAIVTKRDREAVCMLRGHSNTVIAVDLSPVDNMLATGGGDAQAKICESSFLLV